MATSLVASILIGSQSLWLKLLGRPQLFSGSDPVIFAKTALTTTIITSVVWIIVTMLTPPEPEDVLLRFYRKVHPQITGWKPIAAKTPDIPETHDLGRNLWCWMLGCVMTYSALFGVGKILLKNLTIGVPLVLLATACAWQMARELGGLRSET
jgi:hypothetical protein